MSTVQTPDPIITAVMALQSAQQTVDTDATALQTAQAAATNADATVAQCQATLTSDQAAAQSAADGVVAALAKAGYKINLPAPVPSPAGT
jgi:ABC-type branched-subunit amino acid transport system substrate-binding protein